MKKISRSEYQFRKFVANFKKGLEEPSLFWDYIEGNFRSICFNNNIPIIRKKVIREYKWRIEKTNAKLCLENGTCRCCGCEKEALWCTRACSVSNPNNPFCKEEDNLEVCFPRMEEINLNNVNDRKKWEKK